MRKNDYDQIPLLANSAPHHSWAHIILLLTNTPINVTYMLCVCRFLLTVLKPQFCSDMVRISFSIFNILITPLDVSWRPCILLLSFLVSPTWYLYLPGRHNFELKQHIWNVKNSGSASYALLILGTCSFTIFYSVTLHKMGLQNGSWKNGLVKFVKSSIIRPRVAGFCWNLVGWYTMGLVPG